MLIDLEYFDASKGCILEKIIDQQGGTEVCTLLIQSMLSHILISFCSYGFLHSVEITQEISSSGWGGEGSATNQALMVRQQTCGHERRFQTRQRGKSHHPQ